MIRQRHVPLLSIGFGKRTEQAMARRTLLLIVASTALSLGCAERPVTRYAITPDTIAEPSAGATETATAPPAVTSEPYAADPAPTVARAGEPSSFDRRFDVAGQDLLDPMVGGRTRTTVGDIQGDARASRDQSQVAMNNLRRGQNGLDRLPDPVGGNLLEEITDLPERAPAEAWVEPWPEPAETTETADDYGIPTMVGDDLLDDPFVDEPGIETEPVEIAVSREEPVLPVIDMSPLVTTIEVIADETETEPPAEWEPTPTSGNMREVSDDDRREVASDDEPREMAPVGDEVIIDLGDDGMVEVTFDDEPQAMEPFGDDEITDISEGRMIEVTFGDESQEMEPDFGDTRVGDGGMIEVTFDDEPQEMEPNFGDTRVSEGDMVEVTFGDEPQMMEPIGGEVLADVGEGGMVEVTFGGEPQTMEPAFPPADDMGGGGLIEVDAPAPTAEGEPAAPIVVAPWRDQRVAVVNNSTNPTPTGIAASLEDRMRLDGYPLASARGCDVLVVCRSRERKVAPSFDERDPPYAITTTLQYLDQPRASEITPWAASIIVTFESWTDQGQAVDVLRDIEIRVGSQGLESRRFNQRHLDDLRTVLDAWASANSGRRYR
jgi:hypothetical protein